MKVRTLLLLFLAVCEVPLLAACALITYDAYQARRQLSIDYMLDSARVLSTALEERLAAARSSLQALATSPAFDGPDLVAIHRQAVALSQLHGGADVILADRDGTQLVNSYRPLDAPPVRRGTLETVHRVFAEGVPAVSGLFRGAVTQRYLVSVDVPVLRNGAVAYDLSMTLAADSVQRLMQDNTLLAAWSVAVLDQEGRLLARTREPATFVGTLASATLRALIARSPQGTLEHDNLEGIPSLVVYRRSASGWTTAISVPTAVIFADTAWGLAWVVAGVVGFSLLGLVGAVLLGRRIAGAIQRLVDPAVALGGDRAVVAPRQWIHEIDQVARALDEAAETLRQRAQDRDQARDALAQSEALFRDFAESAGDWLWETDAAGRAIYVSERFEAITGMPPSRILGLSREAYVDADYPGTDFASLNAAVLARQPYLNKRLAMPLPDGSVLWFRVSGRPRFSPAGEFLGYRGAASNITVETIADERRQQAEKLAALGRLAGGIAHDFNNVLGAIGGFAGFLREDLPANSEQQRFAERILQAARRARSLIRQILSFARSVPEIRTALQLGQVVGDMLPLIKAAMPSTTRLDLAASTDDVWVLGNETELAQLLLNLCVNASDALEAGYGTVQVRVECPGPGAGSRVPGEGWNMSATADPAGIVDPVCLTVEDDGPGMTAEVLRKVFEPFFTTKPNDRGTGLGLAVVHGIVASMGGAIVIASRRQVGTRVQIFLPRAEPAAAPELAAAAAPPPRGTGAVLLAEDDADGAAMTTAMLTRLGYRVTCCADGVAAGAAFDAAPAQWDLVVTDFAMPQATGLDLIRAIKQRRPALPCLLMTGYMEDLSEVMAREQGADLLLHKPIDLATFGEAVKRLIDQARADAAAPGS